MVENIGGGHVHDMEIPGALFIGWFVGQGIRDWLKSRGVRRVSWRSADRQLTHGCCRRKQQIQELPFYRWVEWGKFGSIAFPRQSQESNPRPPDLESDALTTLHKSTF
ncbi:hypothetical protein ElyMa_006303100 [Elysia marginata]|uniref:Uncharacterized protein n=1 Tax=Elysia marginata TaxID=1093978 RepID=A0AAV4HIR1_9GAST|nr:hypothetical protein ElyMa_006303100 [Elysia marginata]